jgi:hypothetical protein
VACGIPSKCAGRYAERKLNLLVYWLCTRPPTKTDPFWIKRLCARTDLLYGLPRSDKCRQGEIILKIMTLFRAAIAVAAATACVPASANGIMLEANGARANSRWGGELGVGYSITASGFSLRPIIGAFLYKGDNDRYYEQTFSNGQTRCRDGQTGQFASDSECNNVAVKAYAKIEATYTIPLVAEVGGGARFSGDKVRPYGTVAVPLAPKIKLKGNAGPKYYALGFAAAF